ncbi:MAG: hypothetical protein B7Y39_06940 [Bdellovibrio sp. 28-41-41]|nr:MAG: hypothetical protein B7Y39_06940 [Bdellovibrio sp. 28-41-41]
MSNLLIRLIAFNFLWILTALMAKTDYVNYLLLGFFGLFLWDFRRASLRLRFVSILILIIGCAFDFLCGRYSIINFYGDDVFFLPKWLLALWLLFAWVAPYLISQFKDRRFVISALSSVFGPLSYYSGISFGIVNIPNQSFFLIYGVFWGVFIYLIHSIIISRLSVSK